MCYLLSEKSQNKENPITFQIKQTAKKLYKALNNMSTAQLSSLSINHSFFSLSQLNPTLNKESLFKPE